MRYVAQHLNGGIQQPFPPAGQAADQPQRQADAPADGKPNHRAPGANGQVLPQLAAGTQRPEGFDYALRRGQDTARQPAGGGGQLPDKDDADR